MTTPELESLKREMRQVAAAALAGGMIAANRQPMTLEEAQALHRDCYSTLYFDPMNGRYAMWKNERNSKQARAVAQP